MGTNLPNLPNHQYKMAFAQPSILKEQDINNVQEVIMLKRLNFIKGSLENHDPKETTARLRQNAKEKRDERIYELWKTDIEAPTVSEMITRMKEKKKHKKRGVNDESNLQAICNSSENSPDREFSTQRHNISIMSAEEGRNSIMKVEGNNLNTLGENSIFSTTNGSASMNKTGRTGNRDVFLEESS